MTTREFFASLLGVAMCSVMLAASFKNHGLHAILIFLATSMLFLLFYMVFGND